MAKKKYWLGPGVLSNPKGKPVQPDQDIPGPLLKLLGVDRIKQLEAESKIGSQPKSAGYIIAARNTQAALKKSIQETADAKKDNEKLIDDITKLKVENETLKAENKTLKNAEKEKKKAFEKLEKIQGDLDTLKQGYEALTKQLKEAKKGGEEGG